MEKKFSHSKKFWAAVFAAVTPLFNHYFHLGLTPELMMQITGPVVAYILGQGLADLGKNKKQFFQILWACSGFDFYWISSLQAEEVPGFDKRHNRINAKNINSIESFSPEGLALAA